MPLNIEGFTSYPIDPPGANVKRTLEYMAKNPEKYKDQFVVLACGCEPMLAERFGGTLAEQFGNQGYDYTHPEYGRVELKTTWKSMPGSNRYQVQSLRSKKGLCDHFHIADMFLDRHFMVPHDVIFNEADLHNNDDFFRWSSTYNWDDKACMLNTSLLLEYELLEVGRWM